MTLDSLREYQGLTIPDFIPTEAERRERDRMLASTYFLVRTAGTGDTLACKRCAGKHRFLTLFCVERPWSGITNGLYGYWKAAGDAAQFMNPEQSARYARLTRMFGAVEPDLGQAHPRTARSLKLDPRDVDRGAVALGILEPITRAYASKLVDSINQRAHRQLLTLATLDH